MSVILQGLLTTTLITGGYSSGAPPVATTTITHTVLVTGNRQGLREPVIRYRGAP